MNLRKPLLFTALLAVVTAGCGDATTDTTDSEQQQQASTTDAATPGLFDGTHPEGNEHFYFLEPLVDEEPEYDGEFNPDLDTVVEIIEDPDGNGEPIARYTMDPEDTDDDRVIEVDEEEEKYRVNWRVDDVDAEQIYRIRVSAKPENGGGEQQLGHVDVQVETPGGAPEIPPGHDFFRPQNTQPQDADDLLTVRDRGAEPIPFRIEEGALDELPSISAGYRHTCAVFDDDAYCWGDNSKGRLGVGNPDVAASDRPMLVDTGSLEENEHFVSVDAGYRYSCGVTNLGNAYCWGENSDGQLGVGEEEFESTPVPMAVDTENLDDNERFVSIGANATPSSGHTCAVTTENNSYCWGDNALGKLGDGSEETEDQDKPVAVDTENLDDGEWFVNIQPGHTRTCGLTNGQRIYCWGQNLYGSLGIGDGDDRAHYIRPVAVDTDDLEPEPQFTALSAGEFHNCAVSQAGDAYCWGENIDGQLGAFTDTVPSVTTPVPVDMSEADADPTFTAVGAGGWHSCAASGAPDEPAFCWGDNSEGQAGIGADSGDSRIISIPEDSIENGDNFAVITGGEHHTCAATEDAEFYCWGDNEYGQLGDGSTEDQKTPTPVVLEVELSTVFAGAKHTCGTSPDGAPYCWGDNFHGQLGAGTNGQHNRPAPVATDQQFSGVRAGYSHTCGTSGSEAYCWGGNKMGQLGVGHTRNERWPTTVQFDGEDVSSVYPGEMHTCARADDGDVYCWGSNTRGQLGNDSDGENRVTPEKINMTEMTEPLFRMDAGASHNCVVDDDRDVYCWGDNSRGQLGIGESGDTRAVPTEEVKTDHLYYPDLSFSRVSAGGNHTCALQRPDEPNSPLFCWGDNSHGQVGNNSDDDVVDKPVNVGTFSQFSAGSKHTCAVEASGFGPAGDLYCWGDNSDGQLGIDSEQQVITEPTKVASDVAFTNVSAGGDGAHGHTCATEGFFVDAAHCWGNNDFGQLGDGTTEERRSPVPVTDLITP